VGAVIIFDRAHQCHIWAPEIFLGLPICCRTELSLDRLAEPQARFRERCLGLGRVVLHAGFEQSVVFFGGLHHAASLLRARALLLARPNPKRLGAKLGRKGGLDELSVGRGSRIRTCGPLLPKQVLYQAELCPEPQLAQGL
jgi:hypothetical protein